MEEKRRKEKGKREVECWGCGETGHFRRNCPKSKLSDEKGKGDKGDAKVEATATAESNLEGEGAWCMEGLVMDTGVPWGVFDCPVPVPVEFPSRDHGCGIPAKFPRA